MTTRELTHVVRVVHLLDQTAITSATQTTGNLDTLGYESAAIGWDFSVWAGAGSTWTPKLQESTQTGAGTFTDVADINVEWFLNGVSVGYGAANAPIVLDTNTDQCTIVGSYVGGLMRYLRGILTLVSAPTTMVVVPFGLLGHPREVGAKAFSNWNT